MNTKMKITGATASYEFTDKGNTYRVDYTSDGTNGASTSIGLYMNGRRHAGFTSKHFNPSKVSAERLIKAYLIN